MEEATATLTIIRYILFGIVLYYVVRAFLPHRGFKDRELYFEFCDLRRDLTFMAVANEINVNSFSFKFFMRFLSDIIHYSDDYDFGTRTFFRMINRDSKDLAGEKFVAKLKVDAEKQGAEFEKFVYNVFSVVLQAYDKSIILFLITRVSFTYELFKAIYSIIFKKRRESSLAHAADAVKNLRTFYNEECPV